MSTEAVRSGVRFKRRYISATHPITDKPITPTLKAAPPAPSAPAEQPITSSEVNVLVINDSQDMAKEMSMQLTLALPGCSITYAPTIELAKWILGRRSINLVVSSPVLPDGGIARLRDSLQKMKSPPDVVVVGDLALRSAEIFKDSKYEFAAVRRISGRSELPTPISKSRLAPSIRDEATRVDPRIRALGADLRNDLNNPLQEIVAMVFVAQATGGLAQPTNQALEAIDRAAKNMATVVSKLEEKISEVVKS